MENINDTAPFVMELPEWMTYETPGDETTWPQIENFLIDALGLEKTKDV